jgi:cyclase
MLQNRIIPILLLKGNSLYKTVNFKKPNYIGDVINTVRIFNEIEADELIILDINATKKNEKPNFSLLEQVSNECFMPLSYGGGIKDLNTAKKIIEIGFEKVVLNTVNFGEENFIYKLKSEIGSQSIVGVIDYKKSFFGGYNVYSNGLKKKHKISPTDWAKVLVKRGVGELIITSIDNEGTWKGFDTEIIKNILKNVNVPIICNGGGGNINHIKDVFELGVNAVGLGSMVVYQRKGMGILIDIPKL